MSLGNEHGFVLIGLAGPMDVVNLSLSLSLSLSLYKLMVVCFDLQLESMLSYSACNPATAGRSRDWP